MNTISQLIKTELSTRSKAHSADEVTKRRQRMGQSLALFHNESKVNSKIDLQYRNGTMNSDVLYECEPKEIHIECDNVDWMTEKAYAVHFNDGDYWPILKTYGGSLLSVVKLYCDEMKRTFLIDLNTPLLNATTKGVVKPWYVAKFPESSVTQVPKMLKKVNEAMMDIIGDQNTMDILYCYMVHIAQISSTRGLKCKDHDVTLTVEKTTNGRNAVCSAEVSRAPDSEHCSICALINAFMVTMPFISFNGIRIGHNVGVDEKMLLLPTSSFANELVRSSIRDIVNPLHLAKNLMHLINSIYEAKNMTSEDYSTEVMSRFNYKIATKVSTIALSDALRRNVSVDCKIKKVYYSNGTRKLNRPKLVITVPVAFRLTPEYLQAMLNATYAKHISMFKEMGIISYNIYELTCRKSNNQNTYSSKYVTNNKVPLYRSKFTQSTPLSDALRAGWFFKQPYVFYEPFDVTGENTYIDVYVSSTVGYIPNAIREKIKNSIYNNFFEYLKEKELIGAAYERSVTEHRMNVSMEKTGEEARNALLAMIGKSRRKGENGFIAQSLNDVPLTLNSASVSMPDVIHINICTTFVQAVDEKEKVIGILMAPTEKVHIHGLRKTSNMEPLSDL